MNFFQLLKGSRSKEIDRLRKEVETLKQKLEERQEAINKTNAYWKKKVSELQRKRSAV